MTYDIFHVDKPLILESGKVFPKYHLAYTTYGKLNAQKDNVVWIFHALTANSDPAEWWPGLVGDGKLFDPVKHFIVCVNMPGSCYGSIVLLMKIRKQVRFDFMIFLSYTQGYDQGLPAIKKISRY